MMIGQRAVARSRVGTGWIGVLTCTAVLTLGGACASPQAVSPTTEPTTRRPPTGQPPFERTGGSPWAHIRQAQSGLLTANASWSKPDALNVEQSQRIGLAVGDSPALTAKLNSLVPNGQRLPVGTVNVGPDMRAQLHADPNDADVTPSESVNASTPDNVQLLWTWIVTAKHPTSALILTAHLEVPVQGGGSITTDIPLQIPVQRTISYTAGQIFSHWATWSAIAAAGAGVVGWFLRRLKRKVQSARAAAPSTPAPPPHAADPHSKASSPDGGRA